MSMHRAEVYSAALQLPKPKQRRVLRPREVPCPECKQKVAAPCVSAAGEPKGTPCRSRARMAARAMNS